MPLAYPPTQPQRQSGTVYAVYAVSSPGPNRPVPTHGPGGVFLISRSVLGPEGQRRRAGGRKQKQENRGPEGGPGPQGSSGLVPRWGEGGGRDGSVGRPDGRRAPSVGLTNGAVGAVGVGCTVAWAAKMHALSLVLRGFGYEIAPAARCFCFPNRGPGPSDGAGGGALTERSKNLRPVGSVSGDVSLLVR